MNLLTALLLSAVATHCLAGPGYLKLDVHRTALPSKRPLSRRDHDFVADTSINLNNRQEYLVNISVGTPGQPLAVTLDTGSADLWVPASSSALCRDGRCDRGSFDSSRSSTFSLKDTAGFNITYVTPGDSDAGSWVTDTVSIGAGPPIQQQLFGLASNLADSHGVMGLSFASNRTDFDNGVWGSVLDNLLYQNIIDRRAYSLYLNDVQSDHGEILFGGVDTTKYTGDLIALPLQPSLTYGYNSLSVAMRSVAFTDHTGHTTQLTPANFSQVILLDSGGPYIALDNDLFGLIGSGFGAVDSGHGGYLVPCAYANAQGTIDFSFGDASGPTIKVPISQVISPPWYTNQEFQDESSGCLLEFGPPLAGGSVLGSPFLRSTYTVFDLDNVNIAMAQAAVNQTATTSITPMGTGTSIPGVSATAFQWATTIVMNSHATSATTPVPLASLDSLSRYIPRNPTFDLGIRQATSYYCNTTTTTVTSSVTSTDFATTTASTTMTESLTSSLSPTSTSAAGGVSVLPAQAVVVIGLAAGLHLLG